MIPNGQPIFSIDIHPDGSRFATGGQGDGGSSGKVILWNLSPVSSSKNEQNDEIPKVLCVMENHLACVNCVRWSCNGRYLASGGDDRLIMIWQFAGYGAAGSFGGSTNAKSSTGERWRCSHTLKGHTGDVLDLAWSPANQWLASCSIDNTVVIWNVDKFPEIATVLKGHTSLVKGVTWDPVGSYVASQADDKTVKIWKTLDWKLEATITKPFEECNATTHVLRLSWSPDGGYLVSAHAMNNSGPTAQIIERSGWKTEMDFVGHRKAITCTRFNGCVFTKSKPSPSEAEKSAASLPYTCCAVGSRDRSLSIWLTSLRRPLVVLHDLFENSIMDISWSFSGYFLLCCSWDGTVAFVQFTPEEIGQTLTQEEKNKLHKETYGKSSTIVSQPLVIENPAMLAIQEKKNDLSATNGLDQEPAPPLVYPTKQIETRTATGRRRIIPVFVAPQEALGGIPRPFGSSSAFGKINSNVLKTPDKLKLDSSSKAEVSPAKSSNAADHSQSSAGEKKAVDQVKTLSTEEKRESFQSGEKTSDKSNTQVSHKSASKVEDPAQLKKAVLDIRLCEPAKISESKPAEERKENAERSGTAQIPGKEAHRPSSMDFSAEEEQPLPVVPRRPGRPPLAVKRKQGDPGSSPSKKKLKQLRKEHKNYPPPENPAVRTQPVEKEPHPPAIKPTASPHRAATVTNVLSLPKLVRKLSVQSSSNTDTSLLAENEINSEGKIITGALHKITCTCDKQDVWFTVLSSPIRLLEANRFLVCASCHNHTVHIFSASSGRRILPPLCFGSSTSPVAKLRCRGHHVMAVDAACNLTVWDTKKSKVVVDNRSFLHLLPDLHRDKATPHHTPVLRLCSLMEQGHPLITLLDGKSYSFSVDLSTWVLVSSVDTSVDQLSKNIAVTGGSDANMTSHEKEVFTLLNKRVNNGMGALAARSFSASPALQHSATLSLLEHKVATSVLLQSLPEYRKWLLAYVRYLVQENLELRLREVCDDLIGPPNSRHGSISNQSSSWKPHVLGYQKRSLLRLDVLPLIGSNLSFQRLYTEYQDQLDKAQAQQRPSWQTNVT